jgi:hypothetical protein
MVTRFTQSILVFSMLSLIAAEEVLAHDWTLVGKDAVMSFYIDTNTIQRVSETEVAALSLQNFINEKGQFESMVAGVVYDCIGMRKKDSFTNLYKLFWAEGILVEEFGPEKEWHQMPDDSIGATGGRFACAASSNS